MKDVVNFIYFSNIYLTKYASDYDVQTTLSDVDLVRTIGNFASLTRKSELDDAAVAALLEKMNLDADGPPSRRMPPASSPISMSPRIRQISRPSTRDCTIWRRHGSARATQPITITRRS